MIRERLRQVQERIEKACDSAKRDPREVRLVLVTKNVSVEQIREAFDLGVRDFGENRVQELLEKKPQLPSEIRWHFVGHLQTNKVRNILGQIDLLHSLDRLQLASEIQKRATAKDLTVDVLIQVNTSGEVTKSGFSPDEIVGKTTNGSPLLMCLREFDRIRIHGLMTIGPLTRDPAKVRESFRRCRNLRDRLQLKELSMGMSSDFQIAIEEGATILRIGTAIFGERK